MHNVFGKDEFEDDQENSASEIEELKNLIERILAMDDADNPDSEPDVETQDWEADMEKKIRDVEQGKIKVFDSDPEDLLSFVRKARVKVRVVSSTPSKQGKGNK